MASPGPRVPLCIFCIDDVPADAPETFSSAGAIQCINWEYKVTVTADGKFTHP